MDTKHYHSFTAKSNSNEIQEMNKTKRKKIIEISIMNETDFESNFKFWNVKTINGRRRKKINKNPLELLSFAPLMALHTFSSNRNHKSHFVFLIFMESISYYSAINQ